MRYRDPAAAICAGEAKRSWDDLLGAVLFARPTLPWTCCSKKLGCCIRSLGRLWGEQASTIPAALRFRDRCRT